MPDIMTKRYKFLIPLFITILPLLVVVSCSKDNNTGTPTKTTTTTATPTKLGLYEQSEIVGVDSPTYRVLFMTVPKIGTQTLSDQIDGLVFDTGSGGLVIDANGILPPSMITTSGFNFTGDSTVVDGITITNQSQTIVYGDDASTDVTVYGNLCYADVTLGEPTDAVITVKRLPFFMYYKAVDGNGNDEPAGEFDVLGVNSEYDIAFSNGATVGSPFASFSPGTGLTKGFKMDALGTGNFSTSDEVPLTSGVLTIGLTAADIASTSAYKFTQLTYDATDGAVPVVPSTITYNSQTFNAYVIYDSGTDPYNYIESNSATKNTTTQLPTGVAVAVKSTGTSFEYPFTTSATDYITYVENPSSSGTNVSILSLEYFLDNGYLIDYPDHKLGLKNN